MAKRLSTDQLNLLIECFQSVQDPRVQNRSRHLLVDIIVISVCAILCGAEGIGDIETFCLSKQAWLTKYLKLPNGIPSYDTIARVLSIIDPSQMEKAFLSWVEEISSAGVTKRISIDGKATAGTKQGRSQHVLHVVSAFSHELGLSLFETQMGDGGEVKAAKACLEILDVEDVLIMVDAGIGSSGLAEKIIEQKGDYLIPIKNNQAYSRDEIVELFKRETKNIKTAESSEEHRGRGERRSCQLLPASGLSEEFYKRWPSVKSVFAMTRERTTEDRRHVVQQTDDDGKQFYQSNQEPFKYTEEITFYICSRKLTARQAMSEARAHWAIENKVHWVLDVAFNEDGCRVRAKKLAKSLSLIRKIALNLIRKSKTEGSVRGRMKKAGWNDDFLETLLFS